MNNKYNKQWISLLEYNQLLLQEKEIKKDLEDLEYLESAFMIRENKNELFDLLNQEIELRIKIEQFEKEKLFE